MDDNTKAPAAQAPEVTEISKSPAPEKKSAPAAKVEKARPKIRKDFVVSGKFTDSVHLSQINKRDAKRKSLSVLHLQRALNNAGYDEAAADPAGKFGKLTTISLGKWQDDNKFSGDVDEKQAAMLFDGDPNVTIVP